MSERRFPTKTDLLFIAVGPVVWALTGSSAGLLFSAGYAWVVGLSEAWASSAHLQRHVLCRLGAHRGVRQIESGWVWVECHYCGRNSLRATPWRGGSDE